MPIFDQGYQHWQGHLSGQGWRWLAIVRHGVRVQMRNRIVRLLLLVAWLPALGLVAAVAIWGMVEQKNPGATALAALFMPELVQDPQAHRSAFWTLAYSQFFKVEMQFIMLLVVIAGPGLISRDLRFNALPLYLSRPLTRFDYFLGKLGVIATLVGAIAVVPAAIAYAIGACFSLDLSVVKDTWHVLLASVAYGAVITLSVGTFILALSSLSRRSMYIGITWAGIWIITSIIGVTLSTWHRESTRHSVREAEIQRWVAEHPPPPGMQLNGTFPVTEQRASGGLKFVGVAPDQQAVANSWYQARMQAENQAWAKAHLPNREVERSDWGPLLSYVSNLERISDALLNTDGAWVGVGKAQMQAQKMFMPRGHGSPHGVLPEADERIYANERVYQYPWTWSAGVLAGIVGLSVCILLRRVKSLDRLK